MYAIKIPNGAQKGGLNRQVVRVGGVGGRRQLRFDFTYKDIPDPL